MPGPNMLVRYAALLAALGASLGGSRICQAAPAAAATHSVRVGGISNDILVEDVLGIGRVRFDGVIAGELEGQGYRVVSAPGAEAPLTLVGVLKEEACEHLEQSQCRIAVQWELRDVRGAVHYRVTTRAVAEGHRLEPLRRSLVLGALQSLLVRSRFGLQLQDAEAAPDVARRSGEGALGFRACARESLPLPKALRSVSASIVLVESGSNVERGSIVSPDGFVLTGAGELEPHAPLRVKLGAGRTLPARLVAVDPAAHVALLHVAGSFGSTCLPVRSASLAPSAAVFGVTSQASEDRVTSLAGGVVQSSNPEGLSFATDPLLTQSEGAPLLDDAGSLAGMVAANGAAAGQASSVQSVLAALHVKPAAVTDPRLLPSADADESYVRDRDDPPYVLTRRYTYGSSPSAHAWRRAGIVTTAVGAAGVAATWFASHTTNSQAGFDRATVANDVSWVVLGLGAVTTGVSFFLPEPHDVVAAQTAGASARAWHFDLAAGGAGLSGTF